MIAPHLTHFEQEIRYAFGYVNRYYSLRFNSASDRVFNYGGSESDMPATFFEEYVTIDKGGIKLCKNKIPLLDKLWPKLPPDSNNTGPQFDAIGLIFFMLSRIEERDTKMVDKHNRFMSSASFAVKRGWQQIPVVDVFARQTANLITGQRRKENSQFTVKLTHDVDRLRKYHYFLEPVRYTLGDLFRRKIGMSAFKRLKAYRSNEPWHSVNLLMGLSDSIGLKSNFFFMGPSNLSMDSPYCLRMKPLLKKITEMIIMSGHNIGFHPGYATYNNASEFEMQKEYLENIVNLRITEGRQHVIRYDCIHTPTIWNKSGMKHDYSLFYPNEIGFRNGSCRPYQSYDLMSRKKLQLLQTSTAITEFSLLDPRYNNFSIQDALDNCDTVIQNVVKFKGKLVILFHTHQTNGPKWIFYNKLIAQLSARL